MREEIIHLSGEALLVAVAELERATVALIAAVQADMVSRRDNDWHATLGPAFAEFMACRERMGFKALW